MIEDLNKTIAALADTRAGWVIRRDAAELLGELAKRSLTALKANVNEHDTDVRSAVEKALASVGNAGGGASESAGEAAAGTPPTMKALALACVKKPKRAVRREGTGFVVRSAMKEGRTQDVTISRFKREDGRELIRVYTECGPADPESIAWAVRNNNQCIYCAFNVEDRDGVDHLTIVAHFDPKHVTPGMVRDAVKEMAYYGDWLEQKLGGGDAH
jgi:hypothetical protein